MKTPIKNLLSYAKSRLLLRLWLSIMLLVALVIIFLWFVQIRMLEPNYVNLTITDLNTRVKEAANEIMSTDLVFSDKDNPLYLLSKSIKGKVFLIDQDGTIIIAYNNGLIPSPADLSSDQSGIVAENYQTILAGVSIGLVDKSTQGDPLIIVGVPLRYQKQPAAILLYNKVTELNALQTLNRKQLLTLSLILTFFASFLALLLADNFARPILGIQKNVDQLTKGDFSVSPTVIRRDELGQLSESVAKLSQELQRIDILRKEIIANVSHEFRAPLSLIIGYSEMVRDITGKNDQVRNHNMELILQEAKRLSEMVDDIMDYSQFQAGYASIKTEPCNLNELVAAAVDYGRYLTNQYDLKIHYRTEISDFYVEVDPLKISQVLRNLLNNAINHTANKACIDIQICQTADAVRVMISNPGEPIPTEDQKLIWERYKRIQHQGGRHEGTGIGLAIVSNILDAHHLNYGVSSTSDSNTFWFEFKK